ncbi:MAG: Histidine kinase protein [Candidatus Magasanikbacteria bacterium]|nr:Histidine kinase protein [Candidatus Magasanikbacteria bacterium]
MGFLNVAQFILIFSVGAIIGVALFVYRNNQKNASNVVFSLLSLVIAVWLVIMYLAVNPTLNLFWSRLTLFNATLMNALFYLLARTIPSAQIPLRRRTLWIMIFVTLAVMIFSGSKYGFTGVAIIKGNAEVTPGPGMLIFALFTTVVYVAGLIELVRKMRATDGSIAAQMRIVLIGFGAMVGLLITTVMIPVAVFHTRFFVPFAPLYTLIFLMATAYAILQYRLFNIKVVATQALIVALVFVLASEGFSSSTVLLLLIKLGFAAFVAMLGVLLSRSVAREVAARKKIESLAGSLKRANAELAKLDEVKTEFISIAAHQLRSPLTVIKGYTSMLEEGDFGKLAPAVRGALHKIYASNERLVALIDEFLDISRIESGRARYQFASFKIGALIAQAVKEMRQRAKSKIVPIHIDLRVLSGLPTVYADEEKIRHAVENYIDNALKYTPQGVVRIDAKKSAGGVEVTVTDTGIGLAPEDQSRAFEKFHRGRTAVEKIVEGTGIGLYVVKRFIEGHGGRVWAHSPGPGKGSAFGFWIPLRPPESAIKAAAEAVNKSHEAIQLAQAAVRKS